MTEYKLNLHLFDEGAGDGGAPTDGAQAAAAAESGAATEQVQEQAQDTKAQYEARRKALAEEFPDHDESYMQSQFGRRMKAAQDEAKAAKGKLDEISPMFATLAARYGLDVNDHAAIAKAVESDTSFLEDVAAEKGMSVEEYKAYIAQQRELDELREFKRKASDQEMFNRNMDAWLKYAEENTKQVFPNFNLYQALNGKNGETLFNLLMSGFDVTTAYKMAYVDDIMAGVMNEAAQTAKRQTMQDIQARGMRPNEGGKNNAPVNTRVNPAKLSKEEREEYLRRAQRGEVITFR